MRVGLVVVFTTGILATTQPARAIRPFITDDARVVGSGHLQLESWWRRDRGSFQHWAIGAIGPNDHIELSLGGVHGSNRAIDGGVYAISGPLAQGKFLLLPARENSWPGLAIAIGGQSPLGKGGFELPGWSTFGYLAATESLFSDELLLVHANVGLALIDAAASEPARLTWGVGSQLRTVGDLHLVAELFSGDPYVPASGGAVQGGFRYIFNDHLQLDGTAGGGVFGDTLLPIWFSSGIRVVSHKLW